MMKRAWFVASVIAALASRDNFLWLLLASLDWQLLATSGPGLAPSAGLAIGVAMTLTGAGQLSGGAVGRRHPSGAPSAP